jgi:hypothetical protein
MASGYHQIEIQEKAKEKSAFLCYKSHYQFTKLPLAVIMDQLYISDA